MRRCRHEGGTEEVGKSEGDGWWCSVRGQNGVEGGGSSSPCFGVPGIDWTRM